MNTQKLIKICTSVILACCISGVYLIFYIFHIFNQVDQMYVPGRHIRWVVEEPETLVNIYPLPLIAQDTYVTEEPIVIVEPIYVGTSLTASRGVCKGPSGKETWYNLNMDKVVMNMRDKGYTEEDYPYYIREDGVKMLGDFVIVAADLNVHPRGTVLQTSLGQGLVCDTGDFTETSDVELDIATNW